MTTQASDEKKPSAPTLTTVAAQPPTDKTAPKETCRIFISRKTTDSQILGRATSNRKKLIAWANDRLTFFDAALIQPGKKWRKEIRKEIKRADILLLVVTRPAQDDFDWLLYEAGLFDMLKGDKNLICIYPEGSKPPDQLADIQGVEATEKNVRMLLERIYTDNVFTNTRTPLNPNVPEAFPGEIGAIAMETAQDVSGVPGMACTVTYVNPYIQLILPAGTSSISGDIEIESNMRTLRTLFKLKIKPPHRESWTWADLEEAVDFGDDDPLQFNKLWMREAEVLIGKMLKGKSEDRQIRSRFIAQDKRIWAPEIEIWRAYDSGKKTIDIAFSLDVQDDSLQKAKAPVALAANLNLAVRIRHDLIETYLLRLPHWQDGKASLFSELSDLVKTIERDGFFIRWLTKAAWAEAFDVEDTMKVIDLEKEFGQKIYPKLHKALDEKKVKDASEALKLWSSNNAEFLSIGIPQYTKLLRLDT